MGKKILLIIIACVFGVSVSLAQVQWKLPITVTDGLNSLVLKYGIHPSGSNGFNAGLDTLSPPAGPVGSFDGRLRVSNPLDDYLVDIRSNAAGPDTFFVHYAAESSHGPIVLSWNVAQLDSLAQNFRITDNITGGLFTLDMRTTSSFNTSSTGGLTASSVRLIIFPPYTPVQLASFTGRVVNQQGHVRLDWRTLSETNNYGFFVQKSANGQHETYQTISELIPGHGTTLEPHDYRWTDVNPASGTWYYRLQQVDLDGSLNYSEGIIPSGVTRVKEQSIPKEFGLNQNYPNPFNPTTVIEYAIPKISNVKIDVYNIVGQHIATLVDAIKAAGFHSVEFRANGFSSGLYFYRMTADGNVNFMKKMVLMK